MDVSFLFGDVFDIGSLILLCVELVLVLTVDGHGFGGQVKFACSIIWLEYTGVRRYQINSEIVAAKDKAANIVIA
jgi:hypothetical protein